MELEKLKEELKRRNVFHDCYLELTLETGDIVFGRYSLGGERGGINLYMFNNGTFDWQHYDSSEITHLTKLPLRRGELPKSLEAIMKDVGDLN